MFTKLTLSAIVASFVVATSGVAMAAPKQAVRTVDQLPASTYLSFGPVRPAVSVKKPSNMKIQDRGFNESIGN